MKKINTISIVILLGIFAWYYFYGIFSVKNVPVVEPVKNEIQTNQLESKEVIQKRYEQNLKNTQEIQKISSLKDLNPENLKTQIKEVNWKKEIALYGLFVNYLSKAEISSLDIFTQKIEYLNKFATNNWVRFSESNYLMTINSYLYNNNYIFCKNNSDEIQKRQEETKIIKYVFDVCKNNKQI